MITFKNLFKMEDTNLPPEKRARLEFEGADSLREILDFYSPPIDEDEEHTNDVNDEEHTDDVNDEDEEYTDDVNDEDEMSLLTTVDTLKGIVQDLMSRKDSDYIHLELEYDSTLESLEEYKQNSENAREKIAALEEELNEATMKLDGKDREIENAKEKFFNFGNETTKLIFDLQEKLKFSQEKLNEKEERLSKFELLLRESTNEIRNLHQKNQQANEENKLLKENLEEKEVKISQLCESLSKSKNELPKEVVMKMSEMEKKIEILEFSKKEEKKNFFVLNNEDSNQLSFRLVEKEEELRNLELNNKDAVKEIENKENKIKKMDEELLKKNLDIQRLKSRSEKIFNMLKEKDDATSRLKENFRKHFVELSRRLAFLEKQRSVLDPNVTQILGSLKPIKPVSKLQSLPGVNIRLNGESLISET